MEPLTDDDIDRLINLTSVSPGAALVHRAVNEIDRLRQQLAASEARGFAVAAEACVVLGGLAQSDGGGTYCTLRERVSELEKQLADVTAERDELKQRERTLETVDEAVKVSLVRFLQEVAEIHGMDIDSHSPAAIVEACKDIAEARDVLRSIVRDMGIETADPESGVEMTAYELACAVGGSIVGLRGIRDQLRAELQMSEARRELVTAAYERAVKIVEVGPHAAAKREAKELSESARTLQELQGIVEKLRAELLQQPPTLEWLRETFGEPSKRHGTVTEWGDYESPFWIMYQIGGHVSVCVQGQNVMVPKDTRAAVLATVAETNGMT